VVYRVGWETFTVQNLFQPVKVDAFWSYNCILSLLPSLNLVPRCHSVPPGLGGSGFDIKPAVNFPKEVVLGIFRDFWRVVSPRFS